MKKVSGRERDKVEKSSFSGVYRKHQRNCLEDDEY
jgi:hypothetical protein